MAEGLRRLAQPSPGTLVAPYVDLGFDQAIICLRDSLASWPGADDGADTSGEGEAFEALEKLSSYRLGASRLYADRPETLRHVALGMLARLSAYYDKHRKSGLLDTFFGSPVARPYQMFGSAVFFAPAPHPDATYRLDPVNRYVCRSGSWYREAYVETRERNSKLGADPARCGPEAPQRHWLRAPARGEGRAQVPRKDHRRADRGPPRVGASARGSHGARRPLPARGHSCRGKRHARGLTRGRGARGRALRAHDGGRRSESDARSTISRSHRPPQPACPWPLPCQAPTSRAVCSALRMRRPHS